MTRSPLNLEAVLANGELERRAPRVPDGAAEARAIASLDEALAGAPRSVLQKVADAALELCTAGSAGVSLLEQDNGRPVFRWHAVSGQFIRHGGAAMPREHSPSGTVLERGAPQLMLCPERYFTPLLELKPTIVEALFVPLEAHGRGIGTVWALSHSAERRFSAADRRILQVLARYAGHACERAGGAAHRPQAARKRILVVDDGADAAESLAALLRHMGHEVEVANDGSVALTRARRLRPEVVLLDIGLPSMDGYEVARRLREEMGSRPLIVAVTGFGGEEVRRKAIAAGFDQHLVKPLDARFLSSLLG